MSRGVRHGFANDPQDFVAGRRLQCARCSFGLWLKDDGAKGRSGFHQLVEARFQVAAGGGDSQISHPVARSPYFAGGTGRVKTAMRPKAKCSPSV